MGVLQPNPCNNVFVAKDPGPDAQALLGLKRPHWALPELSQRGALVVAMGMAMAPVVVVARSKEGWPPLMWGL